LRPLLIFSFLTPAVDRFIRGQSWGNRRFLVNAQAKDDDGGHIRKNGFGLVATNRLG
jgi:hypothetical protein